MRRSAAMAFAFLALYWAAAPLLACMVPERAMTVQERECCKHMAEMCGSTHMPQSHSCCKTEVRSGYTMVVTSDQQFAPSLGAVSAVTAPALPHHPDWFHDNVPHHPPAEYCPDITVLRI